MFKYFTNVIAKDYASLYLVNKFNLSTVIDNSINFNIFPGEKYYIVNFVNKKSNCVIVFNTNKIVYYDICNKPLLQKVLFKFLCNPLNVELHLISSSTMLGIISLKEDFKKLYFYPLKNNNCVNIFKQFVNKNQDLDIYESFNQELIDLCISELDIIRNQEGYNKLSQKLYYSYIAHNKSVITPVTKDS